MDKKLKDIIENTYTLSDAHYRLGLLRKALEKMVFSGEEIEREELEKNLYDLAREDASGHVGAVLNWDSIIEELDSENFYKRIEEISEQLESLESIILYVPCELPNEKIAELGQWFRSNLSSDMIIDLRVDPWVAGGCAFVWKNKYYDYSFKYFVEQRRGELKDALVEYGPDGHGEEVQQTATGKEPGNSGEFENEVLEG